MRSIALPLASLAMILCGASLATAQDLEVGSFGARVSSEGGWVRKELNPDLGKDQFHCRVGKALFGKKSQVFAAVLEFPELHESKTDCERTLEMMIQGMDGKGASKVETTRVGEVLRASCSVEGNVGMVQISYRLDLLSRSGLTYVFLTWGQLSEAGLVRKKADRFVAGFEFPDTNSEWARSTVPSAQEFRIRGFEIRFSVRPSVFEKKDFEGDLICAFNSLDMNHELYGFEHAGASPDDVIDGAFDVLREDYPEIVEVSRDTEEVSGFRSRAATARLEHKTITLLAVPLGDGRVLQFRYFALGSPESARADRDLFRRTLAISPIARVLAFPEPGPNFVPAPIGPNLSRILATSTRVGDTDLPFVLGGRLLPGGDLLFWAEDRIVRLDRGEGSVEYLLAPGEWEHCSAVQWQGRWLTSTRTEAVEELIGGVAEPLDFPARCLAVVGDDLLLARSVPIEGLPGVWSIPGSGNQLLIRRTAEGHETVLLELPGLFVDQIQVDAAGERALLLATERVTVISDSHLRVSRLFEVRLAGGERRELGEWDGLITAAVSDDGWIVTGRPRGRPLGIYRARATGKPEPLLTGVGCLGIGATSERLFYVSDRDRVEQSDGDFQVYSVPLADLAKTGPIAQPFSASILSEIARSVLDLSSEAPRTEEEIREYVRGATAIAMERFHSPLPTEGNSVDAVIEEIVPVSPELDSSGEVLLSMLLTVALLDQGAVWVEGEATDWLTWHTRRGSVVDNAFAVGHDPVWMVHSCIFDREGYWRAGSGILDAAAGRTVYLGLDSSALAMKLENAVPRSSEAILASGDPEGVIELLEGHAANLFLRDRIYRHVCAIRGPAVVLPIAEHFAGAPHVTALDRIVRLSALLMLAESPSQAEALSPEIFAAIQAHPREPALYLLLGDAYERSKPDEPEYARVCYERVLELSPWGMNAITATMGLQRLE